MSARCDDVRALAPELALGLVSGGERAEALGHIDTCGGCRAVVEELARVADSLLLLAPEMEPPPGFESRVLERLVPGRARRRRWPIAIAAAAVVVVAVGIGALAGAAARQPDRLEREYIDALRELGGRALVAGRLETSDGRQAGQVVLYRGDISWIFATVDDSGVAGDFTVVLRARDGTNVSVPGLDVRGGRGSVGERLEGELRRFRRIEVVDGAGNVRYVARFSFGGRD